MVITENLQTKYVAGWCQNLAVALHEKTGLPLIAAVETDWDGEDIEVLVHAWVEWNDTYGLHIKGLETPDEILEEFGVDEPRIHQFTKEELFELTGCPTDEEWTEANAIADALLSSLI